MYKLTVKGDFAASHSLRNYEGKCKNLHGHTWKVDVGISGKELNATGMLVDFKEIKNSLKNVLEQFDHQHLNDLEPFQKINPTSENIAKVIFDKISKENACAVSEVTVWESENASATYSP
ncbi:MAG: 6-carboxytetrahydropterin synthase QueD [Candidatus Aceula meridiana]|nr:6-carboxytetrahydropterin synthase QueD [Candidatus Aceula meridiana]